MKSKYKPLLVSLFIALAFIILGLVSPSPTQCPDDYTQAQIDAANCTVGAYIGIPPVYDFLIAGVVVSIGSLMTLLKTSSANNKK